MTLKKWGEGIPEYTPKDLFYNAMALFGQIKGYIVGDIPIFERYSKG